ncbi:hypothetical protein FSP39_022772 [Pinctada imbricata]|uniref:Uncharacterized protein n=1 Tax=Pinctada imbricata TaxID=66713 RepID=A0AA88XH30_PINIB|nr:hypothetical protein FSP39_022772 [Pinctada imbricata]
MTNGENTNSSTGPTLNKAQQLFEHLFRNGYRQAIIPLCSDDDKVTVKVDIALRELIKLDEKQQLIELQIWMRLKWNDCTLTWNSSEFNGVNAITVPFHMIWMPDITLYEGASDEDNMPGKKEYFAQIQSDGTVGYNFPSIITASCRIDATYFPYDRQNCSLMFGSWSHHGNLIDIEFLNHHADTEALVSHNEWDVVSVKAYKHVFYYNCCPEPYPDVTFYVILERFPKFYILTVFIPCVIISLLSVFGVMLPAVTGDKMTLQVTVLLTVIVFLLLVQDKLPSSSDTFPYLGIFFVVAMFLTSLSCVMSGITIYLYHGGLSGKVSGCAQRICLKYIARCLCITSSGNIDYDDCKEEIEVGHVETHSVLNNNNVIGAAQIQNSSSDDTKLENGDIHATDEHGARKTRHSNKDIGNVRWQREALAHVVDRIFMIVYIVLASINILFFFYVMRNELYRY